MSVSASSSMSKSSKASFTASPSAKPSDHARGPPPPLPEDLSILTPELLTYYVQDLSFYDAIEVKDQLYTLGTYALLSQNRTELTITSDTFILTVTKPSATENQTIGTDTLAISLPPLGTLYPDAAAVSLIHWKINVYENQSSVVPDSPTFTLSLLDQSSALVEVSDLPIPIQMGWSLNISDTDPRYLPPPLYMARCDTNELYIQKENTYEKFTGAEMIEAAKWKVPCLLDSLLFFNCSKQTPFSYEAFECPRPFYTPSCMYWSPVNQTWQSDGCHAVTGNQSFLVCECTHLTDFTGRINAIAQTNQELFANAANVYSLDGLTRYAQWYGTFGGIAAGFLCLAIYLVWKDRIATQRFVKALRTNASLQHLLRHSPTSPLYRYDSNSIVQTQETVPVNTVSVKPSPDIQSSSRWKQLLDRIAIQHSRLQVFARFDPRLSRLFRLICLFVIQFHSLFVTALLYGFTYSDETTMGIADTILLACITSALNIPVVKLFLRLLNHVGLKEFKYQYALLYSEFKRRAKFETLALAYFKQTQETMLPTQDIQDDIEVVANQQMEVESEETNCISILCAAIPCSRRRTKQSKAQLTKAQLLKQCQDCVAVPYPIIEVSSSIWSYIPCHTIQGVLFCMIGFGWFGWCLQYLLLFAASKETHVGTSILTSYATSEITTIFFQQPLIVCISYGIIHLLHRFQSRLPKKLQEFLFGERKNDIPALYYFTSPWQQNTHSTLTGEYEYAIFVQCAAAASQVSEHSYAPLRAAAIQLKQDNPSKIHDDEVVRLYDQLWIVQDIRIKKNATHTSNSHSIEASK